MLWEEESSFCACYPSLTFKVSWESFDRNKSLSALYRYFSNGMQGFSLYSREEQAYMK